MKDDNTKYLKSMDQSLKSIDKELKKANKRQERDSTELREPGKVTAPFVSGKEIAFGEEADRKRQELKG